tara:strand:+ start:497 stop:712 length:216 start_codon:yes stop_codon:yes gene_type:complete
MNSQTDDWLHFRFVINNPDMTVTRSESGEYIADLDGRKYAIGCQGFDMRSDPSPADLLEDKILNDLKTKGK